eukprot:Skav236258  [mRNA]  locus=scaffold829:523926:524504:- [translate_table: standard]
MCGVESVAAQNFPKLCNLSHVRRLRFPQCDFQTQKSVWGRVVVEQKCDEHTREDLMGKIGRAPHLEARLQREKGLTPEHMEPADLVFTVWAVVDPKIVLHRISERYEACGWFSGGSTACPTWHSLKRMCIAHSCSSNGGSTAGGLPLGAEACICFETMLLARETRGFGAVNRLLQPMRLLQLQGKGDYDTVI